MLGSPQYNTLVDEIEDELGIRKENNRDPSFQENEIRSDYGSDGHVQSSGKKF